MSYFLCQWDFLSFYCRFILQSHVVVAVSKILNMSRMEDCHLGHHLRTKFMILDRDVSACTPMIREATIRRAPPIPVKKCKREERESSEPNLSYDLRVL